MASKKKSWSDRLSLFLSRFDQDVQSQLVGVPSAPVDVQLLRMLRG